MGSSSVRLAHALFIVPRAHVRFDRMFQTEMYELFHRRAPARLAHLICTPLINVALVTAVAALVPGGAFIAAGAIVLWSLYVDRIAGLLVIPLALAAAVGSREVASLFGEHVVVGALGVAFAGGFAQAVSHASEPIPPPWTGSHCFMPLGRWLRSAPPTRIAILALLSPTVFPLLEVWAAPRVWVLQALHLMMRAGYRPELRARLESRVVEMLADARTGWPQPALAPSSIPAS